VAEKLLVVRFGSLGDVILTFGAGEALARARPRAQIVYLVKDQYADLVAAQPWVSEVRALKDEDRGFWKGRAFRKELRRESWSAVLDLQDNPRSRWFTRGLARLHARWDARRGQRRAWVWKRSFRWLGLREEPVRPAWLRFRDAAKEIGAAEALPPRVVFPEAADQRAQSFFNEWAAAVSPAPVMAIAPAAAWATKEWPEERTIELGKRLVGTGWRVLLVGRAEERARLKEIGAWVSGEPSARWMTADLLTVAAALSKSRAAVVPDSGLMHLAVAVGTPVAALFGSTAPELGFAPSGAGNKILQRDLSCRPCHVHGRTSCPLGHHHCMTQIESDPVYEAAVALATQRVG
jgi:heptosyltransferase-2